MDCLRFLFWNIKNNPLNVGRITQYGRKQQIDILALCEAGFVQTEDLHGYVEVKHIMANNDIVVLINPQYKVYYTRERNRYCLLRVENGYDINFAVVHLNSQLFSSGETNRAIDINQMISDLKIEENKYMNQNTLVVGDFNEEPYAEKMTGPLAFNSVFFKCSIGDGKKGRHEAKLDVFYNPMLHVLHDDNNDQIAKGTYYYPNNREWCLFDQVLLKKPLVEHFDQDRLKIISELDDVSLVSEHKTNGKISDHVPISFEISRTEV